MMFVLGMVAGAAIALVAFVAYMAPKHWDWYQQNVTLKESLRKAIERGDHYKSLTNSIEWGPQPATVKIKTPIYGDSNFDPGPIEHRFDDIMDGDK